MRCQQAKHNLNMVLDGNCDHNNFSNCQCGNDIMEAVFQNKHYNVVNNTDYQFGFCPLSPLQLYEGKPVHW